jgi:4-hydroxy-2-oxoheptanedioate aldolase
MAMTTENMRVQRIREFRNKLNQGFVLGPFSKTSDPAFIEAMGHAGFDFVVLDLEHGPTSVQHLQHLIRAAELSGIFPIVRVKEHNLSLIGEVLDIGAGGIQAPQISDVQTAQAVVQAAKFSPAGMRGVCRFVRAANYSATDRFKYFQEANEAVVVVQLEGKEALERLEQIIAVSGIDIIFVGPYDLSQSLGVAGQINHPLVIETIKEIVAKCLRRRIIVGTFVDTVADTHKWRDLGVRYLCYSVDVGMFYEKCKQDVETLRGQTRKREKR